MIKKNAQGNYEIGEERYSKMQIALYNMLDLVCVASDYCKHNGEHKVISPLLTVMKQVVYESRKVTDNF